MTAPISNGSTTTRLHHYAGHYSKLSQQQPHLGQTAKKLSQRAQKHQNLANFPEQGELFRVSQTNSPRRANFFARADVGTPAHYQSAHQAPLVWRAPEGQAAAQAAAGWQGQHGLAGLAPDKFRMQFDCMKLQQCSETLHFQHYKFIV